VVPSAICLALAGAISGRLSDKFGYRVFTMLGLTLTGTALFTMAATLSPESSLVQVIPLLMISSIGVGMFNSPNNSSILGAVERSRYGVVSALTQLTRNAAGITSIAMSTTIVAATMGSLGLPPSLDALGSAGGGDVAAAFMSGLHRAYFVLGCLMLVGIVISAFKGRTVEPQDAPAQASHGEPMPAYKRRV
jgi:MFS family permease